MQDTRSTFSHLLCRFRNAAALSQEELAERAGLSRRGISDLERGLSQAPRLETVRLLAEALALGNEDRTALLTAARPYPRAHGPSVAAPAGSGSLPRPLTRLIGRDAELAALRAALQDTGERFLT